MDKHPELGGSIPSGPFISLKRRSKGETGEQRNTGCGQGESEEIAAITRISAHNSGRTLQYRSLRVNGNMHMQLNINARRSHLKLAYKRSNVVHCSDPWTVLDKYYFLDKYY